MAKCVALPQSGIQSENYQFKSQLINYTSALPSVSYYEDIHRQQIYAHLGRERWVADPTSVNNNHTHCLAYQNDTDNPYDRVPPIVHSKSQLTSAEKPPSFCSLVPTDLLVQPSKDVTQQPPPNGQTCGKDPHLGPRSMERNRQVL